MPAKDSAAIAPDEPLDAAFSRIANALVARAVREVANASRGSPTGVHEARKALKRFRALIRLFRPAIPQTYTLLDTAARRAAKALAPLRDREVKAQTAEKLVARGGGGRADRARLPLPAPTENIRQIAGSTMQAGELLSALRGLLLLTEPRQMSEAQLRRSLARHYKTARRQLRKAQSAPTAAALHRLRRYADFHRHHVGFLAAGRPKLRRRAKRAARLHELLGEHHDLVVLCRDKNAPPQIAEAGRQHRRKLARRALKRTARLYHDKPGRFAARALRR
jgi:CHAD domain-containing protein